MLNDYCFRSKFLGCALWYFSSLCTVAELMFSPDSVLSWSWDAVLDAASDSVRKKFLPDIQNCPEIDCRKSSNPLLQIKSLLM
jgi:hypothetical protein